MSANIEELHELLALVEGHIDPAHCREVDERYRRSLSYDPVDRPPILIRAPFGKRIPLPAPWDRFRRYSFREAFDDPAAMLQNQLLTFVVPGLLLRDDNPLAIRGNHGTIQMATLMGAAWQIHEDNNPWAEPVGTERVREIAASTAPLDAEAGIFPRAIGVLRYFTEQLAAYPLCWEWIQRSMPDLQGPLNNAEQLWGSEIYYAFAEEPELVEQLLTRMTDVMLDVIEFFRPLTHERAAPALHTQNAYIVPGRLLVRSDSSILLSSSMYEEFVRPHEARLFAAEGPGTIHFCGDGSQLIKSMVEIPGLQGLDFGQANMMDIPSIYSHCREHKVALTRLAPSREELVSGQARRDYPTGSIFFYETESFEDAVEVMKAYSG